MSRVKVVVARRRASQGGPARSLRVPSRDTASRVQARHSRAYQERKKLLPSFLVSGQPAVQSHRLEVLLVPARVDRVEHMVRRRWREPDPTADRTKKTQFSVLEHNLGAEPCSTWALKAHKGVLADSHPSRARIRQKARSPRAKRSASGRIRPASLHQPRAGVEPDASLAAALVVAPHAVLAKEQQGLILVGDLLIRLAFGRQRPPPNPQMVNSFAISASSASRPLGRNL